MKYIWSWVLLIVFAVDCPAQSVADVARKERERRKNTHSAVTVTSGATTTTTAATSSTAAVPTTPAPEAPKTVKPNVPASPGPKDNQGRDEKYWREKFQKARDDLKRAEERVQVLDLRVKELNTQLLRQSDVYNREYRLGPEITDAQKQLDDARKEADQAKQKITDLEDELRRSGGLPGWAR